VFKQIDGLGNVKYATFVTVVKTAVCVIHGQASVENGFSINKGIEKSNVSDAANCCCTKDALKKYDS